jgi:ketosteroid isomerase-like protein
MGTEFPVTQILKTVDSKDAQAFSSHLTDDAVFRYGAQEPVKGREAVRDYVAGFFGTVRTLEHQVIDTWQGEGSFVCRGDVTYTKLDGTQVSVPFTNVYKLEGNLVREYLVYIDPTPLMG